jgi:DNA polymerase III sliding clamp (beta) subunit (PCNA family)
VTYAAEDFPRLPETDDSAAFTVDKEAFVDTIARVSRSASRSERRAYLGAEERERRALVRHELTST